MICFSAVLILLGLPLLIVYFLQPADKKNKLWLVMGALFMGAALFVFVFGKLLGAP